MSAPPTLSREAAANAAARGFPQLSSSSYTWPQQQAPAAPAAPASPPYHFQPIGTAASAASAASAAPGIELRGGPHLPPDIFPPHLFRLGTMADGTQYIMWRPPRRVETRADEYKRISQEKKVYGSSLDVKIQRALLDNRIDRALEYARLTGYSFTDPTVIEEPELIPGFPRGGRSRRMKRKTHRKKANRRTRKRTHKRSTRK